MVFIGNKSFEPLLRESINLPANTISYVEIQRTFFKKKGGHYGECLEDLNSSKSPYYKYFIENGQKYRQDDCFEIIRQSIIIEKCGCFVSFYAYKYKPENLTTLCTTYSQLKCSIYYYFSSEISKLNNNLCPMECDSIKYTLTTRTSPLTFTQRLVNKRNLTDLEYFSNIAKIKLFYTELGHTEIIEIPNYTWFSLLSNIGGTMSLFIGMSIVSLIELIELLICLITLKCNGNHSISSST
jgi:hypothetical protein